MWKLDPEFVFVLMTDCKRLLFLAKSLKGSQENSWSTRLRYLFRKSQVRPAFQLMTEPEPSLRSTQAKEKGNYLTVSWRGRRVNSCSTVPNTK